MAHLFEHPGYVTLAFIGQGMYGKCYKVQHQETGQIFAVKVMTYTNPQGRTKQLLVQEMQLHRRLNHPNIIRCVSAIHDEDAMELRLFSEFCSGGDLKNYVARLGKDEYIPEERLWSMMGQILRALAYCHSPSKPGFEQGKKVIHRDLKPDNIMLSDNGTIKLADFGFSREIGFDDAAMTLVGSPMYMAPEVFQHKPYDEKCDIWSLGGVMHYMASKLVPYLVKTRVELERAINAENRAPIPAQYSREFKDIIATMMRLNPLDRPSAADLLKLPRFAKMFADQDANDVLNLDTLETGAPGASEPHVERVPAPVPDAGLLKKAINQIVAKDGSSDQQIELLSAQLEKQADLLADAEQKLNAMAELAQKRLEVITLLRCTNKSGRAVTDKGETALILAVKNRDYDMIRRLVPFEARTGNNQGKTALMYAADLDDTTAIGLLLDLEGGMQDIPGGTALMRACNGGKLNAAKMLVEKEKRLTKKDGSTALIFAVMNGTDALIDLLFPHEAGMAMKDGRTALMSACYAGRLNAVKKLLPVEHSMQDINGKTCVYYSERGNHKDVIDCVKKWIAENEQ